MRTKGCCFRGTTSIRWNEKPAHSTPDAPRTGLIEVTLYRAYPCRSTLDTVNFFGNLPGDIQRCATAEVFSPRQLLLYQRFKRLLLLVRSCSIDGSNYNKIVQRGQFWYFGPHIMSYFLDGGKAFVLFLTSLAIGSSL